VDSLEKKSAEDKNFALLPQNIGNYRAIELPTRHFTSRRVLSGTSFFSPGCAQEIFPGVLPPSHESRRHLLERGCLLLKFSTSLTFTNPILHAYAWLGAWAQ
jgi:hypothetical protein